MNNDNYIRFVNEWESYKKSVRVESFVLDQIEILSLKDIVNGIAYFYLIDPMDMGAIYQVPQVVRARNLDSWCLDLIAKQGLAFRADLSCKSKKSFLIPGVMISKAWNDIFGLSGLSAAPSLMRDYLLAALFREVGDAYLTTRRRGRFRILEAIHMTGRDAIGTNMEEIVSALCMNGAVVSQFSSDYYGFETTLLFPERTKEGMTLALTIRDSDIGVESLSFYAAWELNGGLAYVGSLKKKHCSKCSLNSLIPEINKLLYDAENNSLIPVDLSINDVINKVSPILGRKRMIKFRSYLEKRSLKGLDLLSYASRFNCDFYTQQKLLLRGAIGEFLKGGDANAACAG